MSTSTPVVSANTSSMIGIGGTIVGPPAVIAGRSITEMPSSATTNA